MGCWSLDSGERGSFALARRIDLAGALVEMVAEIVERLGAGASPGVEREAPAGGRLIAQLVGRPAARIGCLGIIVGRRFGDHIMLRRVSGSTNRSLSRAVAYGSTGRAMIPRSTAPRGRRPSAEDFERRRISDGIEGAAGKLRVEIERRVRRVTDVLVGFREYSFHVSFRRFFRLSFSFLGAQALRADCPVG